MKKNEKINAIIELHRKLTPGCKKEFLKFFKNKKKRYSFINGKKTNKNLKDGDFIESPNYVSGEPLIEPVVEDISLTSERKKQIDSEIKRRIDLWLKNDSFFGMSDGGYYSSFLSNLGLYEISYFKETWMCDDDFNPFVTEIEYNSKNCQDLLRENFLIHYSNLTEKENLYIQEQIRIVESKQFLLEAIGLCKELSESDFKQFKSIYKRELKNDERIEMEELIKRYIESKNEFTEVYINEDKQKYLNENWIFSTNVPNLTDKCRCLHCNEEITIGDYKLTQLNSRGFQYISCPNFPECDGTLIDWRFTE